jgi:uncharacterized protein YjiS (DUF1127 family)
MRSEALHNFYFQVINNRDRSKIEFSSRVLDALRLWRKRAIVRQQLRHVENHLLYDIGITRADVEIQANKPFWRE